MEIRLDKTHLMKVQLMLYGMNNGFPRAFSRALNRTTSMTKTGMIKLARRDYNYKAGAIRKRIDVKKSTYKQLSASVKSSGRHLNMVDITGTRKTNKGLSVNVKKATGIKLLPRVFKAPGKHSGKEIALRRPGNPRGQHKVLYARYGPPGSGGKPGSKARLDSFYPPHPELIFRTDENWAELQKTADQTLRSRLEHEMDAILKGYAK